MKLEFVNINETPIDEINLLEQETFQYKQSLSKIDSEFLLKFEGLSMINPTYIGHIYASVSSDQADIISFLIKENYRRKGFGSILFKKFLQKLCKKGIKSIFLEVSKQNKIAQNFYYKYKFQKVGVRPRYYKKKISRVDGYILKGLTHEIINTVS